jgi:hypothetical protein
MASLMAENKFKINLKILLEMAVINNLSFKKKRKVWALLVTEIEKVYRDRRDKARNKKVGLEIQAETLIVQLRLQMF